MALQTEAGLTLLEKSKLILKFGCVTHLRRHSTDVQDLKNGTSHVTEKVIAPEGEMHHLM